ncbi:MAG: hypothetical protein LBU65_09280 [Planctomycetaceae bacterium]|jgi:hypothetical protein|nr:hypothetical protein [Planctomycetaceae bacterium]
MLTNTAGSVNGYDPSGLSFGVAGVGVGCAMGSNMQAQNNRATLATDVRLKQGLSRLQQSLDYFDKLMDIYQNIGDAAELMTMGPVGLFMEFGTAMMAASAKFMPQLKSISSAIPGPIHGEIPLPSILIDRMKKYTTLIKNNKVQEIIGTIATIFLARTVGFSTVSFQLAYHGIDAVYHTAGTLGINMYVIAESKGDSAKLSKGAAKGDQMYGKWINKSITDLAKKNKGNSDYSDFANMNELNVPMIAMIVKLDVGGKPSIDFCLNIYSGKDSINTPNSWGAPFE